MSQNSPSDDLTREQARAQKIENDKAERELKILIQDDQKAALRENNERLAAEAKQKAEELKKVADKKERKRRKEQQDAQNEQEKQAQEEADRKSKWSRIAIGVVVAVVLLCAYLFYTISQGQEAAKLRLPSAYQRLYDGPLPGKAVQGTVSFTGRDKDNVETCAEICNKLSKCRGFNYKADKCEIVSSYNNFAQTTNSPGSTAYTKI